MDSGEKVSGSLVIAGRYSAELLELADEILDEMACLVHLPVENARVLRLLLGGITGVLPAARSGSITAIGIEGFICEYGIGFHLRQQHVGACKIMT